MTNMPHSLPPVNPRRYADRESHNLAALLLRALWVSDGLRRTYSDHVRRGTYAVLIARAVAATGVGSWTLRQRVVDALQQTGAAILRSRGGQA